MTTQRMTHEQYVVMVSAWRRADILRLTRCAGFTAHGLTTNRALAELLWDKIARFVHEQGA